MGQAPQARSCCLDADGWKQPVKWVVEVETEGIYRNEDAYLDNYCIYPENISDIPPYLECVPRPTHACCAGGLGAQDFCEIAYNPVPAISRRPLRAKVAQLAVSLDAAVIANPLSADLSLPVQTVGITVGPFEDDGESAFWDEDQPFPQLRSPSNSPRSSQGKEVLHRESRVGDRCQPCSEREVPPSGQVARQVQDEQRPPLQTGCTKDASPPQHSQYNYPPAFQGHEQNGGDRACCLWPLRQGYAVDMTRRLDQLNDSSTIKSDGFGSEAQFPDTTRNSPRSAALQVDGLHRTHDRTFENNCVNPSEVHELATSECQRGESSRLEQKIAERKSFERAEAEVSARRGADSHATIPEPRAFASRFEQELHERCDSRLPPSWENVRHSSATASSGSNSVVTGACPEYQVRRVSESPTSKQRPKSPLQIAGYVGTLEEPAPLFSRPTSPASSSQSWQPERPEGVPFPGDDGNRSDLRAAPPSKLLDARPSRGKAATSKSADIQQADRSQPTNLQVEPVHQQYRPHVRRHGPFLKFRVNLEVGACRRGCPPLQLDCLDERIPQIINIDPNVPVSELQVGDFLIETNGIRENQESVLNAANSASRLKLVASRPPTFAVELHKPSGNGSAGVDITRVERGKSLLILSVKTVGATTEWNRLHPERAVRPFDRIVGVNDLEHCEDSMQIMQRIAKSKEKIVLHVTRPRSVLSRSIEE